jgi:maltose alpha-D-glucosyltransferase/alpha-amylase
VRAEDATLVVPGSGAWAEWTSASYLAGYLDAQAGSSLLPETSAEVSTLLDFYLLEKCIYEIGYELDSRPEWVVIPMQDLLGLIGVLA